MRNEHDGGKYRRTGLKVVLDTNVYISAFHSPKDVCAELVEYAAKGYYELIVSPVIVREFARATRRDFQVDEKKHLRFMKFLGKRGKIVVPQSIPDVFKEDPDDIISSLALSPARQTSSSPETSICYGSKRLGRSAS
jgi:predicted nucleic acid-binding protein